MPESTEYQQGSAFPGKIGATLDQSSPAWPAPRRARAGAPNVLFVVLDDTGFAHLGCYGSPIRTPNLDRLAADGLLYRNMHTTALCSPTRACVLTGRNHHSSGMGNIPDYATGYPGYHSRMPMENGFLSEILLQQGYSTLAVGKWHLAPGEDQGGAGPFDRWPLGRGFERFYGFLDGMTDQYYPELTYDNHQVDPPRTPEQGYHLTEDLADRAIGFIADLKQAAPEKPFFLYFCPAATHAPHQVPTEWADRYRGVFDDGWDAYRLSVSARQEFLGIVPMGTELPRRDPDVPEWGVLSSDEKRLYARMMEVFAGFLEHADHHIGRLIDFLRTTGDLDNTLTMILSDNGASAEGGPRGLLSHAWFDNNLPGSLERNLANIDELGGPRHHNHYPWGWAWAGDTPFQRWKRETYRGGVSDPFIVHWPRGFKSRGEIRAQFVHAIDLMPTVLDALGVQPPSEIRGVAQAPIHGVSFAYSFDDANAETRHTTQYFEMFAHRAIYHRGWRAVCPWPGPSFSESGAVGTPITADDLARLDATAWELYHIDEDFSESRNVAAEYPDLLHELITMWYAEAERYQVLPLDGRIVARMGDWRPQVASDRKRFVYYPGTQRVPYYVAPRVYNRAHTITATVEIPRGGADGVLVCHVGGYSLFVQAGRLHYVHNYVDVEHYRVSSEEPLPEGRLTLRYAFQPTAEPDIPQGRGSPGVGRLYVGDDLVGEGEIPVTTPLLFYAMGGGIEIGRDSTAATTALYRPPFAFTGKIQTVTIEVDGGWSRDAITEARSALWRQ